MANDVKRNVRWDPPMARPSSRSWRVTADWHQEMTGGHPDSSKAVRAAWAKMLGSLTALGVLATALPRPGELVSTVVDALNGAGRGTGDRRHPDRDDHQRPGGSGSYAPQRVSCRAATGAGKSAKPGDDHDGERPDQ